MYLQNIILLSFSMLFILFCFYSGTRNQQYHLSGIIAHNGHLYVVVADFGERQRPVGPDCDARIRRTTLHCTRNAIYNLLWFVFLLSSFSSTDEKETFLSNGGQFSGFYKPFKKLLKLHFVSNFVPSLPSKKIGVRRMFIMQCQVFAFLSDQESKRTCQKAMLFQLVTFQSEKYGHVPTCQVTFPLRIPLKQTLVGWGVNLNTWF